MPPNSIASLEFWKDPLPGSDRARLNEIIGVVPKAGMEPPPWHIWKTSRDNLKRYIVLLGKPLLSTPGGSSACALLFDGELRRVNRWCFQTGWRITLESASLEFSDDLASDMLALHVFAVVEMLPGSTSR